MKAIRVTCPHCGASLRVAESAATTTCEYCGTASNVMRRTKILERVVAPAAQSMMPRAVQRHSKGWLGLVLLGLMVPIALAGVCVATSVRQVRQSARTVFPEPAKPAPPTPLAERPPGWQGTDSLLLADVNSDGTPEIVGRGRRVHAGDIIMLLAIDLATGKLVWTGETMGTYRDTYTGKLALDGDQVLYAGETGEVRAYSLAAGKLLWKAQLDERIEYFCAGDDAQHVSAIGADRMLRSLARADGAVATKRAAPKRCTRLPSDAVTPFETQKAGFARDGKLDRQLGLYLDVVVTGPTNARVVSGSRATGTHVTTLVALDDANRERWRATASPDGLGATGAPRTVAVGDKEVCIVYYAKTYMTACWSLADGKRLWDAETPTFFEGLQIVGRSLIVTGHLLRVHDLDTGRVRWQLGT